MSYKDITPGTKVARPIGCRFVESSKGTIGFEIAFKFQQEVQSGDFGPPVMQEERINAVLWLSDKAMENSMKTMVEVLGFNGNDRVDPTTGKLVDPNVINFNQDVELVIEIERNPNDGKEYPKVKWINKLGSGSAFKMLKPEMVQTQLNAIGFKAAFLAAKKNYEASGGASAKPAPAPEPKFPPQAAPEFDEDDLPF